MITKPFRGVQLNKMHLLARGLQHCWVLNELQGDIAFDYINSKILTLSGGAFWETDSVVLNGVGDTMSTPTPSIGNQGTVSFLFNGNGSPQGTGKFCITVDADFQLFRNNSATSISLHIGSVPGVFATADLWDSNLHSITATWDDDANIRQLFVDGIKMTTVTSSFAIPSLSPTFYVGNRGDGIRSIGGSIYHFYMYNRVLPDNIAVQLQGNPYAMFQQESRVQLFSIPAPVAGNPWYYYAQQ
ncbi:hypothetical protein LCGC14_1075870 [marine sediment metagenome]|uniref:LamG-like jellyroll fold domain-containing protein n=1 Tax=marine sediment metagenome TaxID=412755 RepID=A0A0F9PZV4_9ZZZZ